MLQHWPRRFRTSVLRRYIYRSEDARAFLHYFLNYQSVTHLVPSLLSACVSPPRRTRVASAWHPRCTHFSRSRERRFRSSAKGKGRPPCEPSQGNFNPLSVRGARKRKMKKVKEETVEEEVGNEGCDGSATRSPPSRASSTCCWRATRPPRRPGRTYPAMNRGQLREGENAAP